MLEEYDRATARHYAAYRPPLRARILRRLDVGHGVDHSHVILAR